MTRCSSYSPSPHPPYFVVGTEDTTVPPAENALIVAKKYKRFAGDIILVKHPGDHHPHGVADPKPTIDWILKTLKTANP